MQRPLDKVLEEAAEETFESTAYMLSMGEDDALEADGDEWQAVGVPFSGPLSGHLVVRVSVDILPELACNMLGAHGDSLPPLAKQQDLLKHVAGALCDNVLSRIVGSGAILEIGPPTLLADPEAALLEGKSPQARASLYLDAGQAEVSLLVEGAVPELAAASH